MAPECDASSINPDNWSEEERGEFAISPSEGSSDEPHTAVAGTGMVVGTTGPFAVRAGLKVLQACGDAIDAAFATALTQITLAAGSWVSFAGVASLLYYDAATNTVTHVNGNWNAMLNEHNPSTILPTAVPDGRSVLVHGFMDAAGVAQEKWGNLPWASIFEPALYVAENGLTIDQGFATQMGARLPYLLRTPEGREIFLKEDGTPYTVGDTFRQPQLAKTFRGLQTEGARYMYGGPWGEKWVELVRREGGVATMEDLEKYHALVQPPLVGQVRGHTFLGVDKPDVVGASMLQALQTVEAADLRSVGSPYTTAESLYTELRAWAESGGTVEKAGTHSDAVVAMDAQGNIAAMTHSINAVLWGANGIFVDGVSIADSANIQTGAVEDAGPGGRVESPICPVMMLDDAGRPFVATSAIGSGLLELTFVRLADVLEFGDTWNEAVHHPSFHFGRVVTQGEYDPVLLSEVRAMGEPVPEVPESAHATQGYIVGLQVNREEGWIQGGFGGHLGGRAEGYG